MVSNSRPSWWGQATHNRLIALVLVMLVVVPMVATPAETSWHGTAAFAYEGFALILMALLLWRTRWSLTRAGLKQFCKTGSHLPVTLFGAFAALSTLIAGRNGYGEQALLSQIAGILLYFTVATQFRRSEQLARLVDTLVFLTMVASLLGFAQYSGSQITQAVGLFGDHQLFGSFLMVLLPLVSVQAVTEKNPNRQMMAQIATVFGVTALLISQARSAWIGAVAGLALLSVLTLITALRQRTSLRRKHETVLPIMLLTVAAGFFLLVWPSTAQVMGRASSIQKMSAIDTWQIRRHTWSGAVRMIEASPVFGHGLGQYPVLQNRYTWEGMPLSALKMRPSLGEQAHNFYLQTTAELGIVGMLLFASILLVFWGTGLRRVLRMEAGIRRNMLLGSLASSVAFAIDAIASPSWQSGQVAMFLWLSLGLGVSCLRPRGTSEEGVYTASLAEEPATLPTRVSRPMGVLATLTLAALLPTIAFAGVNLYVAPVRAILLPKHAVSTGGRKVEYTLLVQFSDGTQADVSLINTPQAKTTFSETGGTGTLVGANGRDYKPHAGEHDTVTIRGTYTQIPDPHYPAQKGGTVSDTGTLHVSP